MEAMTLSELQHLLERAPAVKIAVVGDLMLDRYVYGAVERVSPEAPIPVMSRSRETAMLGGAGNVARGLAALGARVELAAVAGEDGAANDLVALIRGESRLEADLVVDSSRPTTVKTRFVASGQQLLRLDDEDPRPLAPAAEDKLVAAAETAIAGAAAVLLSDYAKGALSPAVIAACLSAARAAGAPVIVDPKGRSFAPYGDADLIKPNAKELALVTGHAVDTDEEIETALAVALDGCEAKAILVTRAAAGMSLAVRGQPVRHFKARARQVFDVSGAGDTALAAIGAALASGAPIEQAIELAILASGIVVGKVGAAAVSPAELIDAEVAQHFIAHESKIAPLDAVLACVAHWRGSGLRIGFTNGCFDILHRGHVAYLVEARKACDRLIVAVNTDASVRALKGDGRPVNDLEGRALVLAGLASIDLVTPFEADTPIALIEAIRPDVLAKGADYTVETVVGADFVQSYGGEVKLIPLVEGYSTTAAIEKLAAKAEGGA
jgi:D-beta-D-heptose 7-phosphate kinase/D-beta-D-heptose 1-phosphate adenosyltransferase